MALLTILPVWQVAKLTSALNDLKSNHDAAAQQLTRSLGELRDARAEEARQRDKAMAFRREADSAAAAAAAAAQEREHLQHELALAQARAMACRAAQSGLV
jgi:hypothetical protein